jgi:shikimate kinase
MFCYTITTIFAKCYKLSLFAPIFCVKARKVIFFFIFMNIYLLGMPGSGKTTLGKRLAKACGYAFADLDTLLTQRESLPITEIFARKGEAYFRQAESDALKHTLQLSRHVIATGGGTPCFFDNLTWMNEHGVTLFLDVPLAELLKRLTAHSEAQQKRPLVANKSPEELAESLEAMRTQRLPFYEKAQFRFLPHETHPEKMVSFLKEKAPQLFD